MADENMSLRKLQMVELKILLEFKNFCESNNIQYFLMGGTLLGAVRHQGFIPWDDDIDIGMMRSEYDKFVMMAKEELSQDFFIQTNESDSTYAHSFAKMRLNGTEYPEQKDMNIKSHKGICIDIIPFDRTSNNFLFRRLHRFTLSLLDIICQIQHDYKTNLSGIKLKVLRSLSYAISSDHVIRILGRLFRIYNTKDTNFYINSSFFIYPSFIFNEFSELDFEGIKFPAPSGYTAYLKYAYGDYLALPPENKRTKHSEYSPYFGKYNNICSVDDIKNQMTRLNEIGDAACKP